MKRGLGMAGFRGGLRILFNVLKQGKPYSVQISARNNGNIQGTLEVEKIDPIG